MLSAFKHVIGDDHAFEREHGAGGVDVADDDGERHIRDFPAAHHDVSHRGRAVATEAYAGQIAARMHELVVADDGLRACCINAERAVGEFVFDQLNAVAFHARKIGARYRHAGRLVVDENAVDGTDDGVVLRSDRPAHEARHDADGGLQVGVWFRQRDFAIGHDHIARTLVEPDAGCGLVENAGRNCHVGDGNRINADAVRPPERL